MGFLKMRRAPIIRLFLGRSPSDVTGLIVPVFVGVTINTIPWTGPRTEVGKESQKIVLPFFANSNSASAVCSEATIARIKATILHLSPSAIFSGSPKAMFPSLATATDCTAITKFGTFKNFLSTAITETKILGVSSWSVFDSFPNNQSPKSFTHNLFWFLTHASGLS